MNRTKLQEYRKTGIAAAGTLLTIAASFAPDNKYVIAAVAVATAFGVWRVPNARTPQQQGTLLTTDRPQGAGSAGLPGIATLGLPPTNPPIKPPGAA